MKKKYYNKEKANYIKQMLETTEIQKVYWPIIVDIVLRRQYQFKL